MSAARGLSLCNGCLYIGLGLSFGGLTVRLLLTPTIVGWLTVGLLLSVTSVRLLLILTTVGRLLMAISEINLLANAVCTLRHVLANGDHHIFKYGSMVILDCGPVDSPMKDVLKEESENES